MPIVNVAAVQKNQVKEYARSKGKGLQSEGWTFSVEKEYEERGKERREDRRQMDWAVQLSLCTKS